MPHRSWRVETHKDRTQGFSIVSLGLGDVVAFVVALRGLARSRAAVNTEVVEVLRDYVGACDDLEPVSRAELIERVESGGVVILDVRPPQAIVTGRIPGALSVPLDPLDAALAQLPKRAQIGAYCRAPYCVLAPQVVEQLRAEGFN